MKQPTSLHVNGRVHSLTVDPQTPLLYILRNDLGLKAAKFACGLEQCGACKVLVDGQGMPSCRKPVAFFLNKEITTLEGLGDAVTMHRVQRTFIEEQAAQCGYCTAGFIMAAIALLKQNPHPGDDEIRMALGRHLCRCGTYDRIQRAVRRAAQEVSS
jgi:nicotinate dehydrogenase subunit A